MDPYELQQAQRDRRRALLEALRAQAIAPAQTQTVGNRVVPYSPIQGLTQLGQAFLARKGLKDIEAKDTEAAKARQAKSQEATQAVIDAMTGKPQIGGPLRYPEGGQYQPVSPAVPPDYQKAAVMAATTPELSENKALQGVTQAMLSSKLKSAGSAPRPIATSEGFWAPDKAGEWAPMQGKEGTLMPVYGDPALQRKIVEEKKRGESTVKKEGERTQTEMAASAKGAQINMLDTYIDQAKDQAGFWTTGFIGNLFSGVAGTPQHDLANTLDTIKANIGFDKLQQMRDQSPTGGALGQVSERENTLLQQVWGALAQSQSDDQFKENLDRIKTQVHESWKRIADAYEKDYGKKLPDDMNPLKVAPGAPPEGIDPEIWKYMDEESKKLWATQ